MRRLVLCTAMLLGLAAAAASADVIWDNYPGDSFDASKKLNSERWTIVEDAWTVDDAEFDEPVDVISIDWVGIRDSRYDYDLAEFIILLPQRDISGSITGMATLYQSFASYSVLRSIATSGNLETYEGELVLPDIELPAGQYYYGVRLVGDQQAGVGRNWVVGAVNAQANTAFYRNPTAGFSFANWSPVTNVPTFTQSQDFAYRLNGAVVPEPAVVATLLAGALLGLRRR
jgi:hypothetical protein